MLLFERVVSDMTMDNCGFQQIFGEQELQKWLTLDAWMLVKEPTEKQISDSI